MAAAKDRDVIIGGAGGRMGQALLKQLLTPAPARVDSRLRLGGGFEFPGSPHIGADLGRLVGLDGAGLSIADKPDNLIQKTSVLIDFTSPTATKTHLELAARKGAPMVVGTTGFADADMPFFEEAAKHIAIVKSGNTSIGITLLQHLVRQTAERLGTEFDVEIVEAHHRAKVDAPSGTALMLGEAAAKGRGHSLNELREDATRQRKGARMPGEIGFAVVRGGGLVGDHDVIFAGEDEVITLSHRALDRSLFARGAIAAAEWVIDQPPGLYAMDDVLGLH